MIKAGLCLAYIFVLATGCPVQAADLRLGNIKADRILFLGNSITFTKHDPSEREIWKLDCGMAASAPEKDYAHLVASYIAAANQDRAPAMKADNFWLLGQYEQKYADYQPEVELREYLDWQPDILVIGIGENIENLDTPAKEAAFAKSFRGLLETFKKKCNPALFVRGRFMGRNPVQERIMKQCCEEMGGVFVSMDALSGDPLNYAAAEKDTTHYTDGGMLAHPGDRGMKAIADALFEAMKAQGAKGETTPADPKPKHPRLTAWRPSGGFNDPWFLQRGKVTHLFCMTGGGVGHATSTDAVHWDELPMAVRNGPPGSYDEEGLWTGGVIEHGGTIYLYYCNNKRVDGRLRQGISLATSTDGGQTFTKHPNNPLIEPDPKWYYTINDPVPPFAYHGKPMIDCRDMAVVKQPSGDGWLGYVVNRRKGTDPFNSGCIGLWHTKDLVHWEAKGPCWTPDRHNIIEVPDVFKMGEHWYLIGQAGNGYGQANRWSDPNIFMATIVSCADKPEGPFEEVLDDFIVSASRDFQVSTLRSFERYGERLGMLWRHGGDGNRLSLPIKIVERHGGGGLISVYWPGIDNAFGPAQKAADVELQAGDWKVQAVDGFPKDTRARMIRATVSFRGAEAAGLAFLHAGDKVSDPGYALVLDAQAGEVSMVKLPGFTPFHKRRWPIKQGGEHSLRIIAVENLFDVYIDDKLAMMGSDPDIKAGGVSLLARAGAPKFTNIEFRSDD